jgi:uncharacterized GH25 family protein
VLYDDKPVSGATVRLASRLSNTGATKELELVTDANGRFDFGPQIATSYVVAASRS